MTSFGSTRPMRDIFILASGPSLTQKDCDTVARSGVDTLAVSDAYRLIDANYHYACDRKWWEINGKYVRAGTKFTQYGGEDERKWAEANGLKGIQSSSDAGLGLDCIRTNGNSGAQAINLAYLLGFKTFYLLGFDMQWTGGKSHFFGDHPEGLRNVNPNIHVCRFDKLAADLTDNGIEVINCTRETALTQFKRDTLESVMEWLWQQ